MKQGTLILEGGGTRGVFSAGVLDYLMEQECYLSHVLGVSAGACNGVNYVSKQIGRTKDCTIHKDKTYRLVNIKTLVKDKTLFDMDMLFNRYPNEIFPFDYDTYFASDIVNEIVTTNCITGKAEYMKEKTDRDRLMRICRASSSLPVVAPMVRVDEELYLDGGLADSIPIRRAMEIGNRKIVIILTRNLGYRKKAPSLGSIQVYHRAYGKYQNLVKSIINRANKYNKTMEFIERWEKRGKILVIRPQIKTVGRIEQKYNVLLEFYNHGYQQMEKEYNRLREYLEY